MYMKQELYRFILLQINTIIFTAIYKKAGRNFSRPELY